MGSIPVTVARLFATLGKLLYFDCFSQPKSNWVPAAAGEVSWDGPVFWEKFIGDSARVAQANLRYGNGIVAVGSQRH